MPSAASANHRVPTEMLHWLPVAIGLLALYLPVFYELATTLWRVDDYAHGPIILAAIAWLTWRERDALADHGLPAAPRSGFAVLVAGLLIFAVGRSLDITILEVGALAPVLAGTALAMRGTAALRALWFPIMFVAFMVPLPGMFVDALTGPLKQQVSHIAENILFAAGYPVARSGAMLSVGPYQLLVADACSGLNSMFSLSALGLLYLHLMRRASWIHTAIILACILPIAFAANITRTLALVLITYHFGDAAGQGFLHGAAGILMILVAVVIILLLDGVLSRLLSDGKLARSLSP